MRYAKPKSTDEALALPGSDQWRLLAGGTVFCSAQGARPIRDHIRDLKGPGELRHATQMQERIVLGSRATSAEALRAELPPALHGLKPAATEVGSARIHNVGTLAGDLCNASPATDGAPPLPTPDAEVELRSLNGARQVDLPDHSHIERFPANHLSPDSVLGCRFVSVNAGPLSPRGGRDAPDGLDHVACAVIDRGLIVSAGKEPCHA